MEKLSPAIGKKLLGSLPDGLIVADSHGKILYVNDRTCELFGYSRDNLIGSEVEILLPEDSRKRHREHRDEYMKSPYHRPMGVSAELYCIRADGTEFPSDISISPMKIGKETLILCLIRDITDLKCAIESLKTLQKELEERVKSQTQELVVMHKLKDEYIATMGHDLRAPLRAIVANAQLLLDGEFGALSQGQKERITSILNAGMRLDDLVGELLDLSKLEAGKLRVDEEKFRVQDVVTEVEQSFSHELARKGLKFSAKYDTIPELCGDQKKILRILTNLVSNGVKFTERGSVTVDCFYTRGRLKIVVTDTGTGIESADFALLFQPFSRLPAGENITGSGLGLYICKKLTALMRGEIGVESQPGVGSKFTVSIPIDRA